MGTALTDQFSHEGRAVRALVAITALVVVAVALIGGSAEARKLTGSNQGERIVGSQGADRLNGKGGGDRHRGGPGADLVKAADGRTDRVVNGGSGVDRCVVDGVAELAIARNCEKVNVAPLTGGGGGPATGLVVRSVDGLLCDTPLPVGAFTISGDGAEAPVGTATGGGGVVASSSGLPASR